MSLYYLSMIVESYHISDRLEPVVVHFKGKMGTGDICKFISRLKGVSGATSKTES